MLVTSVGSAISLSLSMSHVWSGEIRSASVIVGSTVKIGVCVSLNPALVYIHESVRAQMDLSSPTFQISSRTRMSRPLRMGVQPQEARLPFLAEWSSLLVKYIHLSTQAQNASRSFINISTIFVRRATLNVSSSLNPSPTFSFDLVRTLPFLQWILLPLFVYPNSIQRPWSLFPHTTSLVVSKYSSHKQE